MSLTLRSSTDPARMPTDPEELCSVMPTALGRGAPQKQMLSETSLRHKARSSGATRSLHGASATSSDTTGSSKTTDWGLITRTCAFEHCLHTRQEGKGYDVSESRSPPHRHSSGPKRAVLSFASAARCPNPNNSSKSPPRATTGSSRRRARLKGARSSRSQIPKARDRYQVYKTQSEHPACL